MDVRWGIAGTGGIAARFAEAIALTDGHLAAVGSRSQEHANAFGDRFGIVRRHSSYDALADDDQVDVVYVATPHSRHESDAVLFLEAGRHVLCEKPLALNQAQASRMVAVAQARNRFLMEGIWSRFLPAYRVLGELLAEDRIGPVRFVEGSFGFAMPFGASHRLFDRSLGGGALLDVGLYPLQLCSLVLGAPDRVVADGHVGTSGVDEQVVAVLHHPEGRLGVVQAAIRTNLRNDARIVGESGTIELPAFMHSPDHLVLSTIEGREQIPGHWEGDGLRFQIDHVHECLSAGRTQSPILPLDESIRLAATMDAIRSDLGVVYPGEAEHPSS